MATAVSRRLYFWHLQMSLSAVSSLTGVKLQQNKPFNDVVDIRVAQYSVNQGERQQWTTAVRLSHVNTLVTFNTQITFNFQSYCAYCIHVDDRVSRTCAMGRAPNTPFRDQNFQHFLHDACEACINVEGKVLPPSHLSFSILFSLFLPSPQLLPLNPTRCLEERCKLCQRVQAKPNR